MKYKIIIEETIVQEFSIEAKTIEKAKTKAIEKYENGDLVLSPGELQEKKIKVTSEDENKEIDWCEF